MNANVTDVPATLTYPPVTKVTARDPSDGHGGVCAVLVVLNCKADLVVCIMGVIYHRISRGA